MATTHEGTAAGLPLEQAPGAVPRARRSPSLGRRWPSHWVASVGGPVVAVALALWLTAGAWGGRPPSGVDTMAHLVRAEFAISHLIAHGRVDGWHPGFIVGYQEFLFIGPAFTWAVFLVRVVSAGLLSTTGAFKVVFLGSFVALPLAVAFLAASMGLSHRAAGIAAILTLAVNSPFGGAGLQGLFDVGLVTHQFGAVFFFLSLGGIFRVLDDPRPRWVVFTSLATGGLLVAHGISVIILGALLAVVLPLALVPLSTPESRAARASAIIRRAVREELRALGLLPPAEAPAPEPSTATAVALEKARQGFRGLLIAALATVGLAACTFVPFLAHRHLQGTYSGWATPPLGQRLAEIWRGQILFRPRVSLFVAAGLLYGLYRVYEGRRYALAVAVGPLAYLAVSHAALHEWPNVGTLQLPTRGLGYAGVLAVLPLAALVARITRSLGETGDALAVAAAVAIVLVPLGTSRDVVRQTAEPVPQLREAARQLSQLVPDGARFVTERYFPDEIGRTKVANPDRWLAWASRRNTLNNFNVESTVTAEAAFQSEHILDRPPEAVADAISRLGVTHLVTLSDAAADRMRSSARFRVAWSAAPVAIFAVVPPPGQPDPGALLTSSSPVAARLVKSGPEHLAIDFDTASVAVGTVPIGWSPKWHARIDGRPALLLRAPGGLLQLPIPAGHHRLTLDFRSDLWDYLGLAITLATVAGGGLWLRRRWLERHRPQALLAPA